MKTYEIKNDYESLRLEVPRKNEKHPYMIKGFALLMDFDPHFGWKAWKGLRRGQVARLLAGSKGFRKITH